MALVNLDDDDLQELQDLDDYTIIPRPQEVIDQQRKSSGFKLKHIIDSSNFGSPKGLPEIKPKIKGKTKEKKVVCKHGRKVPAAAAKLPYKSVLSERLPSKKRVADELENKFEMLIQSAKSSLVKHKSESSKTGNESSIQPGYKDMKHLKIMDEPAITPQQRYQVLDARDAAIRSRDVKQDDSKKKKVIGCCPDMCPEKERYSRIAKNCLSVLEMKSIFNQSVPSRDANHSFMVKEYSRSSADQQEPLPHELRPVSVLMFTMDYLIYNIMDIPLDSITLSDWYDFIWNRTRSIRKDITQQQICDIRCVDIIEKCVRFHVHCAEELSEEDTSIFDPKINNENLTKCLQTLKHMYHDLQSRGIQCPNEAEFRAYDILLSLTEGETLRLVKDIRKDMLKTPMVKSAFEAALAFKSNNYVKFFKIIEEADYLSSCILHRYILEARSDALQIIVRAYSTPSSSSTFPTSSLVKDLKFEDTAEAYEFCRCHGLEGNENYVTIERRQFSKSASGLPVSRSFLLVGSKRNTTLGEFPTSSLVKDLKFEDTAEAYEFCRCHGLEGNENYVTIERRQFSKSASGLPVSRSFLLVGSKRNTTLGEFPTSSLVKDLKFEDTAEAYEFCRCHGLEGNENYVTIERRQFSKSASGLPVSRSFLLVGSKRNTTLGEIINRGELPQNPLNWYQPHDSFNDRGILKRNSLGTVFKQNDQELVKSNNEVEIIDISVDVKSQYADSSFSPATSFGKIPSSKLHIKNADIDDLEKARTYLLEKIGKLQTRSYERLKDVKSATAKLSQKTKERKSKPLVSKSHKSIMFSDDSNISQEPDLAKSRLGAVTTKPKTIITTSISSDFSVVFSQKDSIFSNFNNSDVPQPISDVSVTTETEPLQNYMPVTITTASSLFKPSTPTVKSVFHFSSQVFPKNSTFYDSQPTSVTSEDVLASDSDKSLNDLPQKSLLFVKNAQVNSSSQEMSRERIFEPYEGENLSSFEISKEYDPSVPITEIEPMDTEGLSVDDLDNLLSSSEESDEEIEDMREKRREEELAAFSEELAGELFTEGIEECVVSICEEVLHAERNKMLELRDECEMIRKNLMKKTIIKWRYYCERKRQRRQFEKSTLCSPWQPMLLNTPYVVTGVSNPMMVYKKQCNLSRLTAEKIKKRKEISPGWEEFKAEEMFDLTQCKPHSSAYFGKSGILRFFKLCIVFPAESDTSNLTMFLDWIYTKFKLPKSQNSEVNCSNNFILNDGKTVISVRAIQLGVQVPKYKEFLDGITAMILCVPCFSHSEARTKFLKDFAYLLDCDTLLYPYPLFALLLESMQNSTSILSFLNEKLDAVYFNNLKTKCLPEIKDYCKNSKEILEAVDWLIEKRSSYPLLQTCDFRYYLEDSFTFAFNILFCKISLDDFALLKQFPQHVIDFYNKVLKFRSDMLCSDLLMRLCASWPPNEFRKLHPDFKFIDKQKQQKCKQRVKLIFLPNFEGDPRCIESVWHYIEDVAVLACKDKDMLTIRIQNALKSCPFFIDWLAVINICALHLIYAQDSEFLNPSVALYVYYTKEDLETFDCDEFWQDVSADIRKSYLKKIKRKYDSVFESSPKKPKNDVILESVSCDNKLSEEQNYFKNAFDVPDIFSFQRKNLFTPLEAAIAKQKEESDAFLHQLDETVISGNVLNGNQLNPYEGEIFLGDEVSAKKADISFPEFSSSSNLGTKFKTGNRLNPYEVEIFLGDEASAKKADISFPKFSSSSNLGTQFKTGIDWLDNSLQNKSSSEKSFSSIADKLSELKYNIQKSCILEDHFSQLLSKQV